MCLGDETRSGTGNVTSGVVAPNALIEARGVLALGLIHLLVGTAVPGKWSTGEKPKSQSATRNGIGIVSRTDTASTENGTAGAIERVPPPWTKRWLRPMPSGPNLDCLHLNEVSRPLLLMSMDFKIH